MRLAVVTCIAGSLVVCLAAPAEAVRLPRSALRVPLIPQSTNWSCGPASLLSVLLHWRAYDGTERSLHRALGTNARTGTRPEKMVEVARSFGLEAHLRDRLSFRALRQALARGETLILNLQAWPETPRTERWQNTWNAGHYAVLVAMDKTHAYFMDPWVRGAYGTMTLRALSARWHDQHPRGPGRRLVRGAIAIRGDAAAERRRLIPIE